MARRVPWLPGWCRFATASDGGGSTRTPAGFCGLVGHKPSFGRIPHPWSSSVAQLGVLGALATTVDDAALLLDLAAGPDHRDRRSLPAPFAQYAEAIHTLNVRGLRVAWSVDLGFAIVDPEVAAITRKAAHVLVEAGQLELVDAEVSFPESLDVYSKLGDVDTWIDLPEGLWPERADELDPQLVAGYEKGDRLTIRKFATTFTRRHAIERKLAALFDQIDVLITPTAAIPAFPAEGPMPREIAGQKVHPAMAVPFAMLGNIWGGPAISVPAGMTADRPSRRAPPHRRSAPRRHRPAARPRAGGGSAVAAPVPASPLTISEAANPTECGEISALFTSIWGGHQHIPPELGRAIVESGGLRRRGATG